MVEVVRNRSVREKNRGFAFETAGDLEQFGRRRRKLLQSLHKTARMHLDGLEAFGQFSGERDAIFDEVDRLRGLARLGRSPQRQFVAQNLNRQSGTRPVLAQPVMKIVAKT